MKILKSKKLLSFLASTEKTVFFLLYCPKNIWGGVINKGSCKKAVLVAIIFSIVLGSPIIASAGGMEILEAIFGALLARQYGGSKWGMLGAMVGGTAGAIIGTPLMPVVGTFAGAFMGSFLGAMTFEFVQGKDHQRAIRVGFGAFLGVISGKVTKIFVAIMMVVMIGIRLI